jgi:hypothetical protein
VTATNIYAAEEEEMKAFFGVILTMALNLKAQLVEYFINDWLHHYSWMFSVVSVFSKYFGCCILCLLLELKGVCVSEGAR